MKINEVIIKENRLTKERREEIIKDFIQFVRKKLHIKDPVDIDFSYNVANAEKEHHTGSYNKFTHRMWVYG